MTDDASSDEETSEKEKDTKAGNKNDKSRGQSDDNDSVKMKGDFLFLFQHCLLKQDI